MDWSRIQEVVKLLSEAMPAVLKLSLFKGRRAGRLISEATQELLLPSPNVPKARAKIAAAESLTGDRPPEELLHAQELLDKVSRHPTTRRRKKASRKKAGRKKARRRSA